MPKITAFKKCATETTKLRTAALEPFCCGQSETVAKTSYCPEKGIHRGNGQPKGKETIFYGFSFASVPVNPCQLFWFCYL